MRRRDFITLVGGGVAAWPLTVRAQQPATPVIGLLSSRSPAVDTLPIAVIRQGLNELGLVEGQNVALDYRWADGQYDRLAALAADLVRRQVAVIVAIGGEVSALAAKAASATIPIVVGAGADPVRSGLVTNLHHPGGNEAASRNAFNKSAHALSPREAALLAAVLPNPRRRSARRPGPLVRRLAAIYEARGIAQAALAPCAKPATLHASLDRALVRRSMSQNDDLSM